MTEKGDHRHAPLNDRVRNDRNPPAFEKMANVVHACPASSHLPNQRV